MKIRVLRNFDCYEAGQVFDEWPAGMCELLIYRGLIEEVGELETAEAGAETERAEVTWKPKKKKQ